MAELEENRSCDLSQLRESVHIHTRKIMDSCLDKDCIEDLRVYLTEESQEALDHASGARARCAELMQVLLDVRPAQFHRGYYSVDLTYFYRVIADLTGGCSRPTSIYGLAVFSKRAILCGGEGSTHVFSSLRSGCTCAQTQPEAVVEAVDPMLLASRVVELCGVPVPAEVVEIPEPILQQFDSPLVLSGGARRLYVTLGQFSVLRLERDAQLTVPTFAYILPSKECCDNPGCEESPCEVFGRIAFPTDAFRPVSCEQSAPDCGCSE